MPRLFSILIMLPIVLIGIWSFAEDSKSSTPTTTFSSMTTTTVPDPSASGRPEAQWSALCTLKGKSVTLEVQSKSGDPFEDDMQASLKIGFKKVNIPKMKALFRPIVPSSRFQLCDKTMGLSVEKTNMLILFAKDDRPAMEELVAVLVDPTSRKILDVNRNLGAFFREPAGRSLQFERTSTGFRSLMVQGFNRNALSDSADELVVGWVNVTVQKGKISAKWEKSLPDSHAVYSTPNVAAAAEQKKK